MHVLEVVRPVVQGGVERKLRAFRRGHLLPQGHHVACVEDAVDLGVDAIKLNQVQAAVETVTFGVEVVGNLRHARAKWQTFDDPLRRLDQTESKAGLGRDLLPGREGPRRRADGLAVTIAQWVRGEIDPGLARHASQPQRVSAAGSGVIHTRLGIRRGVRGHREHRESEVECAHVPDEVLVERPVDRDPVATAAGEVVVEAARCELRPSADRSERNGQDDERNTIQQTHIAQPRTPREPGCDVDICFSGKIAVTLIKLI